MKGKCLSQIERLCIKKIVDTEGTCIFNNTFIPGVSILSGKDYNNELLGVYTFEEIEKEWDNDIHVIRETLENQHRAVDWDSYVWFFDHAEHEECLEFYGETYDFMENEIPNIATKELDELLDIIEEYYYKYRKYYMAKVKSIKENENELRAN